MSADEPITRRQAMLAGGARLIAFDDLEDAPA